MNFIKQIMDFEKYLKEKDVGRYDSLLDAFELYRADKLEADIDHEIDNLFRLYSVVDVKKSLKKKGIN